MADGKVFVTVAPDTQTSPYGSWLYALDQRTGATVWVKRIEGTYWTSHPAYDSGRVFVANFDGLVRAFSAATGQLLWESAFPGAYGFSSIPVASRGRVLYTAADRLDSSNESTAALRESDGALLWQQGAEGAQGAEAADEARDYVATPGTAVTAFETTSGNVAWHHASGSGGGGVTSSLGGGRLYVRTFPWGDGLILRSDTGAVLGQFQADTAPTLAGGVALFLSHSVLRAQSLSTGATLWQFTGDGSLSSAPLVVDGVAYIGSISGRVYGLKLGSGAVVWSASADARINPPNPSGSVVPLAGMGAAPGILAVPASGLLVAFGPQGPGSGQPRTKRPLSRLRVPHTIRWRRLRRHGLPFSVDIGLAPASLRAVLKVPPRRVKGARRGPVTIAHLRRHVSRPGRVRLRLVVAKRRVRSVAPHRLRLRLVLSQGGRTQATAKRTVRVLRRAARSRDRHRPG